MKDLILLAVFLIAFGVQGIPAPSTEPARLVTIKYVLTPFRTFEIPGTDMKGISLEALSEAIAKYHKDHPGSTYEVFAEVKCLPETSDEIIRAIRRAGVILEHYWAPVSFVDISRPAGKYGHGHIDLLNRGDRMKNPAFKGMELYSWKSGGREWHFSLLPGTNRNKSEDEIKDPERMLIGPENLKTRLVVLAEGEFVLWRNLGKDAVPEEIAKDLKEFCGRAGINLERAQ